MKKANKNSPKRSHKKSIVRSHKKKAVKAKRGRPRGIDRMPVATKISRVLYHKLQEYVFKNKKTIVEVLESAISKEIS